ncbi:MAG: phosphoethanolamine--lipid A transferase [Desulfobulbus sp.]|jgi:lipid A ethanolaminephosphotransferase|uniref:phosphoethanolamine transferase n=1 Tax=Desulfobulbus sp. TaxID=895 RepID=UPI00284AD5B8|nr:phosphoethanolamine--lipid A transferase [Desulfobulbus sp.]MDR2549070.1 phosphoethanolamine--lipid A transferase [Desulfobulbus sp.]
MKISQTTLHLAASILLVALYNTTFFRHVLAVYPPTADNALFLASLAIGLVAVLMLLLTVIGWQRTTKPVLSVLLVLAAAIAYFTDDYNVVIDHTMIANIVQTNAREAYDLFSVKLLVYLLLLGIVPAGGVWWLRLAPASWEKELLTKAKVTVVCVAAVFGLLFLSSDFFFSFFRAHEALRYYTNPTYSLYSLGKYLKKNYAATRAAVRPIGTDARIPATTGGRKLVILVVGEAARADRFSLNGYARPTNPLLQQEQVVSFANMYSSGTATAFSVPCMFSPYPREQCNEQKAVATENLLDVLQRAGVHVLWRENNSDSKGVALRVPYQDFRRPGLNPMCEGECRDEGMLAGLQEYIDAQKQGDIAIVLHQMGNHGPAYYKRYPSGFDRFTPVCATNQLNECTTEEVGNAYDNAILYTDAFLAKTIALLKKNDQRFETAMIYMSDHGESLGEYGLYLHGLPYAMAPDSQKHVASIFWFDDRFGIDRQALQAKAAERLSHDNLFHTVLGLFAVQTSVYDPSLDITNNVLAHRTPPRPLPPGQGGQTPPDRRGAQPHGPEESGFASYKKQLAQVLPVWLLLHLEEGTRR